MTKENFAKGMALFLIVARNFKADKNTQVVYYSLLKDISDKDFEFAITEILNKTTEIYPTTNFVSLVRDQLRKSEINNNQALNAWDTALTAIKKHGGNSCVAFEDLAIPAVIKIMGGWQTFGFFDVKDTSWKRKEFCDIYNSIAKNDNKNMKLNEFRVKKPKQIESNSKFLQ